MGYKLGFPHTPWLDLMGVSSSQKLANNEQWTNQRFRFDESLRNERTFNCKWPNINPKIHKCFKQAGNNCRYKRLAYQRPTNFKYSRSMVYRKCPWFSFSTFGHVIIKFGMLTWLPLMRKPIVVYDLSLKSLWNLGNFDELSWNWGTSWHYTGCLKNSVAHVCLKIKTILRYTNPSLSCRIYLTQLRCVLNT